MLRCVRTSVEKLRENSKLLFLPRRKIERVRNCVAKYYVLNPELKREKDLMGRDGLEMFIVDNGSVKCAYSA